MFETPVIAYVLAVAVRRRCYVLAPAVEPVDAPINTYFELGFDSSNWYSCTTCVLVMEEWAFVEERELTNWKGQKVCITCQHFTYGLDGHCRTILGCKLKRQQLQQGQHLLKQCQYWSTLVNQSIGA